MNLTFCGTIEKVEVTGSTVALVVSACFIMVTAFLLMTSISATPTSTKKAGSSLAAVMGIFSHQPV